jgi:small subunit ribosomal protein S21
MIAVPPQFRDGLIVRLDPGGSIDQALKVLEKRVERSGLLAELRRHAAFTSRGERRRAKTRRAEQRARRAQQRREHAAS